MGSDGTDNVTHQDGAETPRSARQLRIAIVASTYNAPITGRLLAGARWAYAAAGGPEDRLAVFRAPGAFELPALAAEAARTGRYDAIVAIGCIIRGETTHDRVIAGAVAHALARASVDTATPISFGVLTCNTLEQAEARAAQPESSQPSSDAHAPGVLRKSTASNKGVDAMRAAIDAAHAMRALHEWEGAVQTSRGGRMQ